MLIGREGGFRANREGPLTSPGIAMMAHAAGNHSGPGERNRKNGLLLTHEAIQGVSRVGIMDAARQSIIPLRYLEREFQMPEEDGGRKITGRRCMSRLQGRF